jgi:hypothetical protein
VTVHSVDGLVQAISRGKGALTKAYPAANMAAAEVFKGIIEAEFAARGVKAGTTQIARRPWPGVLLRRQTEGRVLVVAAPPIHLWNNPTSEHFIVAKGVGGTRRRRAEALGGVASMTRRVNGARVTTASALSEGPGLGIGRLMGLSQTKDSASGKQALSIPGAQRPRLYARHRGTKGRPTFQSAARRAVPSATKAQAAEMRRTVLWEMMK